MEIKILKADGADLETILALQKECYLSEAELHDDFDIPPLKQDLESITDEYNKGVLLKAVIDSSIIGSVRGYALNGTGYIGKLIVQNGFQNKGIGKLLMSTIESNLAYCNRYELFTGFKSQKNLYLYNKLGYKEFKREEISDKLTLVYLEKAKTL
jgi:hypothetical protein